MRYIIQRKTVLKFFLLVFEKSHIYYMYIPLVKSFSGLLGLAKISVKMLRVLPLRYKRVF